MSDGIAFVLATLALLATPGPTNTLLATSGAAAGFQRSLHLVIAEALGYMLSITTLSLAIGPLVQSSQALSIVLRVGCGVFLLYASWRLWREGAAALTSDKPVSFRRVFVATALNPKGIVFAFVIVPFLAHGEPQRAWPYMAALVAMILVVGGSWIVIGAAIRAGAGTRLNASFARRGGALVLCLFAILISGSAFSV